MTSFVEGGDCCVVLVELKIKTEVSAVGNVILLNEKFLKQQLLLGYFMRVSQWIFIGCAIGVLASCGGSSGDGSSSTGSSVSLGTSSSVSSASSSSVAASYLTLAVDRSVVTAEESETFERLVSIDAMGHDINGSVYFSVDITQAPMLSRLDVNSLDVDSPKGTLDLWFKAADTSPTGTQIGRVTIDVCRDALCTSKYQQTPVTLEVVYTVQPETTGDFDCIDSPGIVYEDCVDPSWMGPYGWQEDYATGAYFNYLDNDGTLLILWDEIDLSDEHGKVIDVKYTDDRSRGQINFAPPRVNGQPQVYDLSSFADGSLTFDIRVLDPGVNSRPLYLAVECGWPCSSGRIPLNLAAGSEWQSLSFSVADLVAGGLNLANIEAGFILSTDNGGSTVETPSSQGLHFQLDNIRWVGGVETTPGASGLIVEPAARGITVPQLSEELYAFIFQLQVPEVSVPVYYSADTSLAPFVTKAEFYATDPYNGFFYAKTPAQQDAGTHMGEVTVNACVDEACAEHYPGSPKTLSLVYTVVPVANSSESCVSDPAEMFADCVSTAWLDLSAWERRRIGTSNVAYRTFEGNGSFALRWAVVQDDDTSHGNVIELQHNVDSYSTDRLQFLAAGNDAPDATVDLSEYAEGTLEFDLKVMDWGSSAGFLEMELSCGDSCRISPRRIEVNALNTWTHLTFNVADFVAEGLDLSKVNVGFSIAPPQFFADGAHYKLDNIRWVK